VGGRWIDRFAPQKLIGWGAAIFAAGLLLISQANAMWQITAIFTLFLPFGTVFAGTHLCQALVGRWFTRNRGLALGISAMGTSLGGLLLPRLIVQSIEMIGWRHSMVVAALVVLLVLIPLMLFILRRKPEEFAETTVANAPAAHGAAVYATRELLLTRHFWLIVIGFTPILMAFYAVHHNLGTYAEDIGFTQAQTALVISVLSFSMMAGKLICGRLIDLISHQILYFVVAGSFITGMSCISLQTGFPMLLAGAVAMGFALGGTMPLMSIKVLDHFGAAAYGQVMGLLYIFINLSAVGPVAAGWVRDVTGSYPVVFLLSLIPLGIALVLMLVYGRAPASK
jgi:MFS family permease